MKEASPPYPFVPTLVGAYEWNLLTDVWTWSPELFVLHGLPVRGTEVTTELLLRHRHPDDVEHVEQTIAWAKRTGLPFSCLHRVIRADDEVERMVVLAGYVQRGPDGTAQRVIGHLADVTESHAGTTQDILVTGAVFEQQLADARQALAGQPVIERAKGMLMQRFLLAEGQAWELLTDVSQRSNTKVRDVARMLITTSTGRVGPEVASTYRLLLERADDLQAGRGRSGQPGGRIGAP